MVLGFAAICGLIASDFTGEPKNASSNCIINGVITDKLTGEALTGVEVKLMDTDIKIYTDFEGKFQIKDVPPGAHAISVDYISYQDIVENLHTESGSITNVTIKLKSVQQ